MGDQEELLALGDPGAHHLQEGVEVADVVGEPAHVAPAPLGAPVAPVVEGMDPVARGVEVLEDVGVAAEVVAVAVDEEDLGPGALGDLVAVEEPGPVEGLEEALVGGGGGAGGRWIRHGIGRR